MGSIVASRFREIVGKSKDLAMRSEAAASVRYTSGFLNFDFLNGTVVHVTDIKTSKEIMSYNSIGIIDGSIVFFVGRSACGKTTLALQMAGELIRSFKNGSIHHEDIEGGIADERKYQLIGLKPDEAESRYIQRNAGISAENFFERVMILHDNKLEMSSELTYDTGYLDMSGRKIYKLEPTVVIMDSLALLMPEKILEEEGVAGGMSATSPAKMNAQIFRRMIPMLKMANIILFVINHITDDINLRPKKSQLAFLKQGEALPGGKEAVYLATNILRVDDIEKLKPEEGYKINGAIVELSLVKARSSFNGKKTKLVLNYDIGFDSDLSLLLMLKEAKALTGSAIYPSLGGRDDLKFTQATFKQKLYENEEMQRLFAEECYKVLCTMISDPYHDEDRLNSSRNIQSMIFNLMKNIPDKVAM